MLLYWIWFSCLPKLNTGLKCRLLKHFHSPEDIYHAEPKAFSTLAEVEPASLEALDNKDLTQAKQILQTCTEKDIRILTYSDRAYPIQLRNIPHPPVLLYYKGTLPNFEAQPVIAVVGTRKATSYGMNASRRLSGQIAACGGLVITGGASGIDTMAIHGAMDAEAMPVAVLGNGVDVVYPSANRQLFRQIETQGCLLSEYPPGTPAHSWHSQRSEPRCAGGGSTGTQRGTDHRPECVPAASGRFRRSRQYRCRRLCRQQRPFAGKCHCRLLWLRCG